jgi:hypothetical protein
LVEPPSFSGLNLISCKQKYFFSRECTSDRSFVLYFYSCIERDIPVFLIIMSMNLCFLFSRDGGRITSDGGMMVLAQAERRLAIAEKLAAVIADPRDPDPLRCTSCRRFCAGYDDANVRATTVTPTFPSQMTAKLA